MQKPRAQPVRHFQALWTRSFDARAYRRRGTSQSVGFQCLVAPLAGTP